MLSLLSASIPLATAFNSVSLAVLSTAQIILNPTPKQLTQAVSTHVLAFSSDHRLLLDESEGSFDIATWDKVYDQAHEACCKPVEGDMDEGGNQDLQTFVQRVVEAKLEAESGWKIGE